MKHHVEVLEDNDIITAMGRNYGRMYFPSEKLETNMEDYEAIWGRIREKLEREEKK